MSIKIITEGGVKGSVGLQKQKYVLFGQTKTLYDVKKIVFVHLQQY